MCCILNNTRAQPEEGLVTPPQQQRKLVELPSAAVDARVDEDVAEGIEVPGDSTIGATYKLETLSFLLSQKSHKSVALVCLDCGGKNDLS